MPSGSDGYSSGFGLTAEPHIVVEDLKGRVHLSTPARMYVVCSGLLSLCCTPGFAETAASHAQTASVVADGDSWVIVCSDGLCGNVQRGAGGGLTNDQIAKLANEVWSRLYMSLGGIFGCSPDTAWRRTENHQCIIAQFGKAGSTANVASWQRQSPAIRPRLWLDWPAPLLQVGKKRTAEDVAEALAAKAQEAGSTDDVTVVALKLG